MGIPHIFFLELFVIKKLICTSSFCMLAACSFATAVSYCLNLKISWQTSRRWHWRRLCHSCFVFEGCIFSHRNFPELCRYLLFSPISTHSCEIWWAKEEVSRLLISSETGLTASHLAHLALHNSQVITNFRSFLQLWLCLDFGLGLWIFRLMSGSHRVEDIKSLLPIQKSWAFIKIIWPWLLARSIPLNSDCKSFS